MFASCIGIPVPPLDYAPLLSPRACPPRRGHLPATLGTPVLNLDFLLEDVIQRQKPIDWPGFEARQGAQPLRVVASGLHSEQEAATY